MSVLHRVRRPGVGAVLVGGPVAAAALLGTGIAHADDTTVDVNGWAVQTDGGYASAALSDPSDSLGDGTRVVGSLSILPYPFDHAESIDEFLTPGGTSPYLYIDDQWLSPWFLEVNVGANNGSTGAASEGFFVTAPGGNQVVDLLNVQPNSPSLTVAYNPPVPVVNPDATDTVNVGGLDLASPQDGALFNDLYDAAFLGDTADWSNAATLFGDLLGA